MRLDAFDYELPKSLIAQKPAGARSASRLMVIDRATGRREHRAFHELPSYLTAGDVVVANRSRVIPARLFVRRATGGRVELFVTRILGDDRFIAMANPLRKLHAGDLLRVENGDVTCRVAGREDDRQVRIEMASDCTVSAMLDRHGHVPLPPYIQRDDASTDRERYQTVFAHEGGSVAAPTAGLHFDRALIAALEGAGIHFHSLVLHVGLGTFLPLESEEVEENRLHEESFEIDGATIEAVARAKSEGRRVVAVGTTVTRVLETACERGAFDAAPQTLSGDTGLFIYPGYRFGIVDALVTNFHLPRSSLLLLVCAFLGREATLECYREAVARQYRFYSYGDAMLIR